MSAALLDARPAAPARLGVGAKGLSTASFQAVTRLFEQVSGIRLESSKQPLVEGRLQRLATRGGHASVEAYVGHLLRGASGEDLTALVDRLTTNETYFFREPAHFQHLADTARQRRPAAREAPLRVWSAASSSGEEAYSAAMVLADILGNRPWEVVGTDLSTAVVDAARTGAYPLERASRIPRHYLHKYALRRQAPLDGELLLDDRLRERVRFACANLMQDLPGDLGQFDVIFLRNVLIYFDPPGKADILRRVLRQLRPGGFLYVGHAEPIGNLALPLRAVQSAVYVPA